jgi:hypothetical protein
MDTQLQESPRPNEYVATGERTAVVEVVGEPVRVASDTGAGALGKNSNRICR